MRRRFLGESHFAEQLFRAIAIVAALAVCLVLPVRADKMSDAREQFERAVKMRTMLEGYLEKDRTLSDYKQTIAAYHKVYLITPQADDVTPALVAEAELYQEMGRLFDSKYFQSAIDVYSFLLKQYPGSRYRGGALLAIAQIQKDDLKKPEDAEATYKEYLTRFPRSEKAADAREALKEIAGEPAPSATVQPAAQPANQPPDLQGQRVEPRVADKNTPSVTDIRTWNSQDSTRIVVALNDTIQYNAARISSPDRIYFDLYKAKLGPKLPGKTLDVQSGLLKSVRVAQNKQSVVRLVLDVNGAKDFSTFLLTNPYRLVIDVHSEAAMNAKRTSAPAPSSEAPVNPAAEKPAASSLPTKETVSVVTVSRGAGISPLAKAAAKVAAKTSSPASKPNANKTVAVQPPTEPKPTRDGERSLTRALGLKISRIVIDAGHGGHDTGTIGPHGLMEKDLCLDVALRLGNIIDQKLPGAEVVYTRKDDTFIPLEQRTAIANEAKADLFVSIHANSSHDPAARGIETYYLNFATSPESMEVATRENANSQESLHDLQDLIQKIARNEKVEESKELAGDIQSTLTQRLQLVSQSERNRGVKKAPFVVLIGANMPSVLSEISFVSNPSDERLLRKTDQRQRIADGLYRGIAAYLDSLNSLSYNKQKLVSDNHVSDGRLDPGTVASTGNPK
ncbi:MAG TPA: N-acetylmuramoyl-L-alanine amidase [Candidatus Acidoferrales bacterium]|nr:N-acetylmuramoyl-L-alanine amidase [Candidatus Acidoferrales bacterium]